MPINNNIVHHYPDFCIYITHGNLVPIKGLANRFSKDIPHIIATHTTNQYTLSNAQALAQCLGWDKIEKQFTSTTFVELIQEIKQTAFLGTPSIMLCMDANLGVLAGEKVSDEFFFLIQHIKPGFLFAFSETPKCIEDMHDHLYRKRHLCFNNIHCEVSDKKGIGKAIDMVLSRVKNHSHVKEPTVTIQTLQAAPKEQSILLTEHDKCHENKPVKTCGQYFLSFFSRKSGGQIKIAPEIISKKSTLLPSP